MGVTQDGWTTKGVTFPKGTEFRSNYKGETISGIVESGGLVIDGKTFYSLSSAANKVTGNSVNGWIFWECRLPNETSWKLAKTFRT
ncbi:MAG: DUF2924 domain-containing protein [Candidatus Nitrospinota bacterium M3_3B_026]